MYFAGVFENNQFSIITIEADGENSKNHHRQLLIINKSKINDYLNLKMMPKKFCNLLSHQI